MSPRIPRTGSTGQTGPPRSRARPEILSRNPRSSSGCRAAPAGHDEQGAFARDGAEPCDLGGDPAQFRSRRRLNRQILPCRRINAQDRRPAAEILNAVLIEPAHDLVDRMPGFVRVVILILDPNFGLASVADAIANHVV